MTFEAERMQIASRQSWAAFLFSCVPLRPSAFSALNGAQNAENAEGRRGTQRSIGL